RFVEWAAALPSDAKLRNGEGKAVLKRALEPLLPREILYRTKMGFAVPLDMWFRGSLEERMMASVSGGTLAECGLFDRAHLRRLGAEHRSGQRDHSAVLWALLMFSGFLERTSSNAQRLDASFAA